MQQYPFFQLMSGYPHKKIYHVGNSKFSLKSCREFEAFAEIISEPQKNILLPT